MLTKSVPFLIDANLQGFDRFDTMIASEMVTTAGNVDATVHAERGMVVSCFFKIRAGWPHLLLNIIDEYAFMCTTIVTVASCQIDLLIIVASKSKICNFVSKCWHCGDSRRFGAELVQSKDCYYMFILLCLEDESKVSYLDHPRTLKI